MKRFLIFLFLVPFAVFGQNLKTKIDTDIRGKIYDPRLAANMYQAIVDGMLAVTASGTNTYTATVNPAVTSYQTGYLQTFKFTNANTGASTLNVNGLGAKSLVKDGAGTALASGDLKANTTYLLSYDGTNFQVLNIPGAGGGGGGITNPMTSVGDLILGGTSGTPTRLAIGANNTVLTSNGTTASWQTPSGGGGGFYQTIQNAGSSLTQRNTFNFTEGLNAVDNAGSSRTDVKLGGTLTADVTFAGRRITIKDGGNSDVSNGAGLQIQETTGNVNGAVLDFYNTTAAANNDRIYELHSYINNSLSARKQMTAIYADVQSNTAGAEGGRQLMNITANGTLQEYFKAEPSGGSGVGLTLAQNAFIDQLSGKVNLGPLYNSIGGYFSYGKSLDGQLLGGFANTTTNSGYAEFNISNSSSLVRSASLSFSKFNSSWSNVEAYKTNGATIEAGSSVEGLNLVSSNSTGKVRLYAGSINDTDIKLLAQSSGVTLNGTTVLSALTSNGIVTTSGGTGTLGVTTVLPVANGGTGITNLNTRALITSQVIATDANITASAGQSIFAAANLFTANRTIDLSGLNQDGDYLEIYLGSSQNFNLSPTGQVLYFSDDVNTVTNFLTQLHYQIRRKNGRLYIIN